MLMGQAIRHHARQVREPRYLTFAVSGASLANENKERHVHDIHTIEPVSCKHGARDFSHCVKDYSKQLMSRIIALHPLPE